MIGSFPPERSDDGTPSRGWSWPRDRAPGEQPRWAVGFVHQFTLTRVDDGRRYLTRWWLVNTPWGGVAVHRMDGPDARLTVHDHPFGFVSYVLRGGYWEHRMDTTSAAYKVRERTVLRWNRMRPWDAHCITRVLRKPTWTLVFIGRKVRTWGFWEPEFRAVGYNARYDSVDYRQTRRRVFTDHRDFDSGHIAGGGE